MTNMMHKILSQVKKNGLFFRKLIPIFISVGLLCLGIVHGSVRAASTSVIIAASNSSSTWKSQATAVCSGTNDQNKINTYLTNGNTVQLAPGTYNCNGLIIPASNTTLYGQGNTTIINLGPNYSGNIQISNVSNINIGNLEIEGTLYYAAVYITATTNQSNFNIYGVKCLGPLNGGDCFSVVANGATISNIIFSQCDASSPDGVGFRLGGSGTVYNVTFYHDTVENDGIASTRSNNYMAGFDLADTHGGTVSNIYVISCSVNNAWDDCFHMEYAAIKNNLVIAGCNAVGAAAGNPGYTYGFGYLLSGDIVEYGNTASSNAGGDLYLDGTKHTPVINGITPSTSKKTATAVNQGNCSGVMINIDATHKELVLYSTNGSAVNQNIPLGGYYISNDGNTYTFSGQNLVAQFTSYAVMNLIASSAPSVTTSSPSPNPSSSSFGYNAAGTASVNGTKNNFYFCTPGFTGVTSTGVSMSALVSNADTSSAHNIQLAIYTLSGSTYSLVARTNAISIPANAAKGWVTGNLTTSPSLSSSTTYYLCVNTDSASLNLYCDSQSSNTIYVVSQSFGTWSATFASPTLDWSSHNLGILVNYTGTNTSPPVTNNSPPSSSFGYNATGTASVNGTKNNFYFCTPGFTGVTSTGVSMSALVSNADTSSAHNIQLAIYTLSGSTYSLVARTNTISIPANAAKGWVTGNLTTSPNLSSSTTYYLCVNTDSVSLNLYCDSQSSNAIYVVYQTFGTWSATFASPTLDWSSHNLGIRVN